MKQIIIGKAGNQPFAINDDYVSRRHAIFTYDENTGVMTLKDNASSNGTFVRMGNQFQQITQCNVGPTTDVRLGPSFVFRVGQLFQSAMPKPGPGPTPTTPPKQEKVDISFLRAVSDNYEKTKVQLEQKQTNINGIRMLSMVGAVIGGAFSAILPKAFGQDDTIYYIIGPVVAVAFMILLVIYCSSANKKVIIKRNQNDKRYKMSYCCPKCHTSFTGKIYENILAEGKCPKCKIEFYDSKM